MSAERGELVLRGGTVVDGTGAPARAADVAIRGGRITEVGRIAADGRRELDASGCWVTPGFIDPHTHLDAQLCWDPSGDPCNRHGVTTAVIGLCGFGVAPCAPGGDEYLLRALERVEEIPYASTRAGVAFEWGGWADYWRALGRRPLGINVAGFVPHSPLRCFAMGDRARGERAGARDRDAMVAELRRALAAGALGFATSLGPNHVDGFGDPVPSRFADDEELRALVEACRGRLWQINVKTKFGDDPAPLLAEIERYAQWSQAAGARLTWSPLHADSSVRPDERVLWREVLTQNGALAARGIAVSPQVSALPVGLLLRFDERSCLVAVAGWEKPLAGYFELSPDERRRRLADPDVRGQMRDGLARPAVSSSPVRARFEDWRFLRAPAKPGLVGRSIAEVARAEGRDPIDCLLDQALADGLETLIEIAFSNRDAAGVTALVDDPETLLSLGDAGAHVTSVTNYRYPSYVLETLVRGQGTLPVECAVARMTSQPARILGFGDRGSLKPGLAADVCVIDRERVGVGTASFAYDLPGGTYRLHQVGQGYRAVLVNGVLAVEDDRVTGARAGRTLSGNARLSG